MHQGIHARRSKVIDLLTWLKAAGGERMFAQAVAVLKQEEIESIEIRTIHAAAFGEFVPLGDREHEGVFEKEVFFGSVELDVQSEEQQVELVIMELLDELVRLAFVQEEAQLGITSMRFRCEPGQQVGGDRRNDAEPQWTCEWFALRLRLGKQVGRGFESQPRTRKQAAAGLRQAYLAAIAFKEPHSQRALELLDLTAQGRLGDKAGFSCRSKAAVIDDPGEILELA
jgi:hypothetical protein